MLGLFLSSYLSDKFGRRKILIVGSLLQILTCCLFYFCNSFPTLTLMVAASMISCVMVIVPSYSLLSEVSVDQKIIKWKRVLVLTCISVKCNAIEQSCTQY